MNRFVAERCKGKVRDGGTLKSHVTILRIHHRVWMRHYDGSRLNCRDTDADARSSGW